jgi:hypothetical protein
MNTSGETPLSTVDMEESPLIPAGPEAMKTSSEHAVHQKGLQAGADSSVLNVKTQGAGQDSPHA